MRSARPDTPVAKIAEELRTHSAHVARIDGAISGTPFFIALVPGYLTYLQQEMRMTLRTAALYGRDPRSLRTVGGDARAARRTPRCRGGGGRAGLRSATRESPIGPSTRRSWRTWVHSVYLLLIFGGFMSPSVAEEDKGMLGKVRAVFGVLLGVGIWVMTWVLPLTFMIAMAWGCETHARQLGRRTLLYYDGEADNVLEAIKAADQRSDHGHDKRAILRSVALFLSVADPDRLRRLRPARSPHRRDQLAQRARCARRALAGDRNGRHLQPKVGGAASWQARNQRAPTAGHGAPGPSADPAEDHRPAAFSARVRSLVRAIEENDEAKVEEAILRLSRSRRVFAPLAFVISAFVMLFNGLRLLVSNWRLTLVQILPAMWIWLAMFDLKAHTLHGKSFTVLRGPVLIPIGLVIVTLTVASYFLNAVFAFAISQPGRVEIRPAVARARRHWVPIVLSGAAVGALLAFSTTVVTRWGKPVVRAFARDHRRRDDGQLCGRARAADRGSEAQAVKARQAVNAAPSGGH